MLSTDASLLRYGGDKTPALCGAILDSLSNIPGVSRASASFARPIDSEVRLVGTAGFVEGRTLDTDRRIPYVFDVVGPSYFSTLEIPMLTGRDFGAVDARDSAKVAIINETLARQLFRGEDPIGLRLGHNAHEAVQVSYWCRQRHEVREPHRSTAGDGVLPNHTDAMASPGNAGDRPGEGDRHRAHAA